MESNRSPTTFLEKWAPASFSISAMDADSSDATAAGWRGDRYLVFDHGHDLVWRSVWNSPQSAQASASALKASCVRRFSLTFTTSGADSISTPAPGHAARIRILPGNEILFTLAPSPETAQALTAKFSASPTP